MAPSMASAGDSNQTIRPSPSSFTIRASGRASVIPIIIRCLGLEHPQRGDIALGVGVLGETDEVGEEQGSDSAVDCWSRRAGHGDVIET